MPRYRRDVTEMDSGRIFGILMLLIGIVLLTYGINSTHSISSSFSNLFQGAPSDKSIWLIIGGGILGAVGLVRTVGWRTAK